MNSFMSDKSSIIVLSNSMDTPDGPTSMGSSETRLEPESITTIASTSSTSSGNTRIQCITESMAHNSHEKATSSFISTSVENDGISVINTIQDRPSVELNNQVQELSKMLNDYKTENSELKEQYNFLTNQIEKLTDSQVIKSNDSQKIGDTYIEDNQFIDVQSLVIVEKIKDYLTETDRLLDDEQKNFKLAMSYLINHFWSMIAHQYNEENLVKLKSLRDSLLRKIDKVDQVLKSSREESRDMSALGHVSQSSINSSIHVIDYSSEFEAFSQDTLLIKDKIEQQSELIKSLLTKIQEKETAEKQKLDQKTEIEAEKEKEEEKEEHDISPGSSPSSFMFNYFQKKFESHESEKTAEEPDVSTLTEEKLPESIKNQDESISHNSTSDDSLPSNTDDSDSSFYYYYNVNDFIAIDKTLALNENLNNQVQSVPSSPNDDSETARQQETASLSTLRPNEEDEDRKENETAKETTSNGAKTNNDQDCFQCPVCNVSVDSKLVSFRQFELHVGECNNSDIICMFCLQKFDQDDSDAYEAHVNSHII